MRDVENKRRSLALLLQQPRVSQLKALFESIENSTQETERSGAPARKRNTTLEPLIEGATESHENEIGTETSELADAVRDALDLVENHPVSQTAAVAGRTRTDSSLSNASTTSTASTASSEATETDMADDILKKFAEYAAAAGIRVDIPSQKP